MRLYMPPVNMFSLFYGGGLLAGLMGAVSLGPPINRHICTALIMVVGICAFVHSLRNGLIAQWNALIFAAIIMLMGFSSISELLHHTRENLLYVVNFVCILFSLIIVLVLARSRPEMLKRMVLIFFAVILFFAILQIGFIFFGVGMDPTMTENLDKTYDSLTYGHVGVRSVFVNTNDLAVAGCLLLLYVLYTNDFQKWIVTAISIGTASLVIFSGSRGGALIMLMILIGYYLTNFKRALLAITAFTFAALLIWLLFLQNNFVLSHSYFMTKLATIAEVASQYFANGVQGVSNSSASIRFDAYLQFVEKFWELGLGSFDAQNYEYIIKGNWLMAQDPHSLPIELALLYGYFGLLTFILMIVWMYTVLIRRFGGVRAVGFCIIFIILCFESSSSIGHRAFWILLFAFICRIYYTNNDSWCKNHGSAAIL